MRCFLNIMHVEKHQMSIFEWMHRFYLQPVSWHLHLKAILIFAKPTMSLTALQVNDGIALGSG